MAERKLPSCSCPQRCAEVAPSDQTLIGFFSAVTHLSSGLYFSASILDEPVYVCICSGGGRVEAAVYAGGRGVGSATVKD